MAEPKLIRSGPIKMNKQMTIERLERLHVWLEQEGWYTKANTVWLAIQHLNEHAADPRS